MPRRRYRTYPSATSPSKASAPSGDQYLEYGDKGDALVELQRLLARQKVFSANATGNFLTITRNAVVYFQQTHRGPDGAFLEPTGIVGPDTWWALRNATGPSQRSGLHASIPKGLTPLRERHLEIVPGEEIARLERMYLHVVDVDGDQKLTAEEFQTALTGPLMARVSELAWRVERSASWASRFLRSRTTTGSDGELCLSDDVEPRVFLRTVELELKARRFLVANYSHHPKIEFLGCFDTVAALGLPSPLLDSIINRIPGMAHKFHDFTLSRCGNHAYQALAIDDKRKPFKPLLWTTSSGDEATELVDEVLRRRLRDLTQQFVEAGRRLEGVLGHDPDDWDLFAPVERALVGDATGATEGRAQTVEQVWFTGMHTDVGGGYEERGLSDITLAWMLRHGLEHGMLLYKAPRLAPDPVGVMDDSRGRWATKLIYRRRVDRAAGKGVTPVIDPSVVVRSRATGVAVWRRGKAVFVRPADYPQPLTERATIGPTSNARLDDLIETQEQRWQTWIAKEHEEAAERRAAEVSSSGAGY
jgi:hypothetical protein